MQGNNVILHRFATVVVAVVAIAIPAFVTPYSTCCKSKKQNPQPSKVCQNSIEAESGAVCSHPFGIN